MLKVFLYARSILHMLDRPSQQANCPPRVDTMLSSCHLVLWSCPVDTWPVRWWMLLFLHSAAVLAGGGSMWVPQRPILHAAHAQWPQHENPSHTSFIIWSLSVKTLKAAERKCISFFLPKLNGGHDVHSAASPGLWFSYDPAQNDCAVFLELSLRLILKLILKLLKMFYVYLTGTARSFLAVPALAIG